jgi:hypothetical protein
MNWLACLNVKFEIWTVPFPRAASVGHSMFPVLVHGQSLSTRLRYM